MKGELEVLEGGLLTTIQDQGRNGYRKFGVPVSGVMDTHSSMLANWLVGNSKTEPVLELTLVGGAFKFNSDAIIGISGADADITLNGSPASLNQTLKITEGDVLKIGRVKAGCRVYMTISGDWEVEKVMGSYATCLSAKFGGYNGRALKKGDRIVWKFSDIKANERTVPKKMIPHHSIRNIIRIIEGVEWDFLSDEQKEKFLATDFKVSSQSNRMALRLGGASVKYSGNQEMVSSPVVPGIIQLPSNGSPIILMQDAQSVGGYPRIAKVIDADLWRLGQVWTNNTIRFEMVSLEKAQKLERGYDGLMSELDL